MPESLCAGEMRCVGDRIWDRADLSNGALFRLELGLRSETPGDFERRLNMGYFGCWNFSCLSTIAIEQDGTPEHGWICCHRNI